MALLDKTGFRKVAAATLLLLACLLAVYFRTYAIHGGAVFHFASAQDRAEIIAFNQIKALIGRGIAQELSHMTEPEKERRLNDLAREEIRKSPKEFEESTGKIAAFINRPRPWFWRSKYLVESDPYHYLDQTEQVLATGRSGTEFRAGKVLSPLGNAPYGTWEPFLIHPYAGALFYRVLKLLVHDLKVVEAVAYWPVVLVMMVPFIYAGFARAMGFGLLASFWGMITLTLAPVFVFRTLYGWYDTDAYSYLFPFAILALIFLPFLKGKRILPCSAGAAALTGIYAISWPGWPVIPSVITGSLVASCGVLALARRGKPCPTVKTALKTLGVYWLWTILFLAIALTPAGLMEAVRLAWAVAGKYKLGGEEIWPQIFATVGEARPIGIKEMIRGCGSYGVCLLAVFGMISETVRAFRSGDDRDRLRVLGFMFFSVPFIMLSLQAARFTTLLAMPLAIFASFGVSNLQRALCQASVGSSAAQWKFPRFLRPIICAFVLLTVLWGQLADAHVIGMNPPMLINDVWYGAYEEIKAKTPPDAIVNTWWEQGYFISAVARRRVLVDGGIQDNEVSYWICAALFTNDEKLSAGILRMLNTSRNAAFHYLKGLGLNAASAVALIKIVVRMDRDKAYAALPPVLSDPQKKELLQKTHGDGNLPPIYLMIDDRMIKQNSLVSGFARWDFEKASSLQHVPQASSGEWFGDNAFESYKKKFFEISGQSSPYDLELPLTAREGGVLVFGKKPAAVIDVNKREVTMINPWEKSIGRPISFFVQGSPGNLAEQTYARPNYPVSVLLFKDGDEPLVTMAEPALIRSMLFRLYYLNGEGLKFFKPFITEGSVKGGTCVKVFELDRSAFNS